MKKSLFLSSIVFLALLCTGLWLSGCGGDDANAEDPSSLIDASEIPLNAVIIDTRSDSDCEKYEVAKYSDGHLADAINIPWSDFRGDFSKLNSVEEVETLLGNNGISAADTIVVCGLRGDGYVYWVLKALGHSGIETDGVTATYKSLLDEQIED